MTIYRRDMYVNQKLSLQTTERIGNLQSLVVDDLEHDGLDPEPERIFGGLLEQPGPAAGAGP